MLSGLDSAGIRNRDVVGGLRRNAIMGGFNVKYCWVEKLQGYFGIRKARNDGKLQQIFF
jgi:hypothetical protein